MLPGGLDGDQRYFVTWHIKNEGIPVPKPLDHGRSLIVIHKVKYSKANQAQIRSSANTSDLTQCIHTHTRVKLHRASEMPQKGRDKSTSFQHFPTGHLLLRISSVSWVLEYMEWTHYSVQPLEQKFPPPSKLHYCIRFCTSGKKKDKLLSISCFLMVLFTSQEKHFTPADGVFGGLCSGTPLHGLENAPSAPEWHKFGYCWPELHSDPELWPQLAFLQQQPGDFLSFVLTWDVAVLHQTCGRYRIKNNTRILGVLGGFFLDILEYIIYIKNISRKRGARQPACCTLQSIYLISIFWKKKCFKLFTNLPLVGGKRRETQGIKN